MYLCGWDNVKQKERKISQQGWDSTFTFSCVMNKYFLPESSIQVKMTRQSRIALISRLARTLAPTPSLVLGSRPENHTEGLRNHGPRPSSTFRHCAGGLGGYGGASQHLLLNQHLVFRQCGRGRVNENPSSSSPVYLRHYSENMS